MKRDTTHRTVIAEKNCQKNKARCIHSSGDANCIVDHRSSLNSAVSAASMAWSAGEVASREIEPSTDASEWGRWTFERLERFSSAVNRYDWRPAVRASPWRTRNFDGVGEHVILQEHCGQECVTASNGGRYDTPNGAVFPTFDRAWKAGDPNGALQS